CTTRTCSLSLHDALPISGDLVGAAPAGADRGQDVQRAGAHREPTVLSRPARATIARAMMLTTSVSTNRTRPAAISDARWSWLLRSEEHTSELQSPDHLVC